MPGICASETTTSNGSAAQRSRASAPPAANTSSHSPHMPRSSMRQPARAPPTRHPQTGFDSWQPLRWPRTGQRRRRTARGRNGSPERILGKRRTPADRSGFRGIANDLQRFVLGVRGPVGAAGVQHVEDVGDGDDPGFQGDLPAGQLSAGIPCRPISRGASARYWRPCAGPDCRPRGCRPGRRCQATAGRPLRSCSPPAGSGPDRQCRFIIAHSSSLSGPGFRRMQSGMPILPMSCSGAATNSVSTNSRSIPIVSAMMRLMQPTRITWLPVSLSRCSAAFPSRQTTSMRESIQFCRLLAGLSLPEG